MNRILLFSASLLITPWIACAQSPPTSAPTQPVSPSQAPTAGASEAASWYAGIRGVRSGPFTTAQIKSKIAAGTITSETMVWTAGMSDWVAAGLNAQFSPSFAAPTAMKPPGLPSQVLPPGSGNLSSPKKISKQLEPGPLKKTPFVHTAAVGNIVGHSTYLNCEEFNGNPKALIHITPIWNTPGKEPVYHDHAVGVRYETSVQKWGIFNQDRQAMQPGASFVVVTADAVHTASTANTTANATYVNFPNVNGSSTAPFQITANQTPDGKQGPYNDHPIGIGYDVNQNLWVIFNADMSPMLEGASFNIRFPVSWSYWSRQGDIVENSAYLNGIPPAKGSPDIGVTITQYFNPGASPEGVYNPHQVGAWYDPQAAVWAIFNQDLKPMPQGVAFVVEFHPLTPQ